MKKLSQGGLIIALCATQWGWAAPAKDIVNSAKVHRVAEEPINPAHYLDHKTVVDIANAEGKKSVSSGRTIASEDLLSEQFKTFRDEYIGVRDGIAFDKMINKWVAQLDAEIAAGQKGQKFDKPMENDVKFMVNRMRAFLPMKGVVWRMTPLVHSVVVSQEVLLATLRNFAEQVMINEPDSHVQAQLMYFTMPLPGVKPQMTKEADFLTFLLTEVRPELDRSISGLELMAKNHQMERMDGSRKLGLYLDTKLRFGSNSFADGTAYNTYERFKAVGYGELFAAIARIHRRVAAIDMMGAYDWNGHFQLRQDIAGGFGIGQDVVKEFIDGLPFISGMTRYERNKILSKPKHTTLYSLVKTKESEAAKESGKTDGQIRLENAYFHMSQSAFYIVQAWTALSTEPHDRVWQLDPDLFTGREEQVKTGIANIKKIFYDVDFGNGAFGSPQKLVGALSGHETMVDLKTFLTDPKAQPQDLKKLAASTYDLNHKELIAVKGKAPKDKKQGQEFYYYSTIKEYGSKRPDVLTMMTQIENRETSKPVAFRDYLYGRGTGWSMSIYNPLFGNTLANDEDVTTRMGILNETRGARYVTMLLTGFIR